jgi:hypothetical protein
MDEEPLQKPRRTLSYVENHHLRATSHAQSTSNTHSTNYLQLAIDNLNQLIHESEQQMLAEEQIKTNEDKNALSKIQHLQYEINHRQNSINSLSNKIEKLTFDTYEMLVRLSEAALIRHNRIIVESIEHIDRIVRKDSVAEDSSIEQLKEELTNQQEKLYLIRNQLDIDHNKSITNIGLLNEYQQKRNLLEKSKLKRQSELQNIQKNQSKFDFYLSSIFPFSLNIVDYLQKQVKLQKLRLSIEQQIRVRNEIQQLEQYVESKIYQRRDKSSEMNKINQVLDSHRDGQREINQKTVDASEQRLIKSRSFVTSKPDRKESDAM